MNTDHLSDLPDWDDEKVRDEGDVEHGWMSSPTRIACKALYNKWREIVFMLNGVLIPIAESNDDEDGDPFLKETAQLILSNAYVVGAKIRSSEAGDLYILRMGNAAIIREHAQNISSTLLLFLEEDAVNESYLNVLESEMEKFKQLFIAWAKTFTKDNIIDEWGLFL